MGGLDPSLIGAVSSMVAGALALARLTFHQQRQLLQRLFDFIDDLRRDEIQSREKLASALAGLENAVREQAKVNRQCVERDATRFREPRP